MFKRYRNPFEEESSTKLYDSEKAAEKPSSYPSRTTAPGASYQSSTALKVPPRIYQETASKTASSPYTTSREQDHAAVTSPKTCPPVEQKPLVRPPLNLEQEEPDTTLGEGVVFKGELTFKRLLRIDGIFEGDLVSEGKLIVGPSGVVKSNVKMNEAIVEGVIEGDITIIGRLELRSNAKVFGNIEARLLSVDEGVTIVGHVTAKPNDVETDIQK